MNQDIIQSYKIRIEEIYPRIAELRHEIHSNPELSEHEKETSALIASILKTLNISYEYMAGYGICATIYGKHPENKGITVAIRADMDALPVTEDTGLPYASKNHGVMHACGHDIHTSMLLGTAALLSQDLDKLKGNIRLIFQPAEETIGGAERMIQQGCLKNPNVSSVIGFHVSADAPAGIIQLVNGPMSAASTEFTLEVEGISSHGAHPQNSSDALLAAAHIVTALQSVVSRNLDPLTAGVVTVGTFNSGTKANIISGKTICSGIIRALSLESRAFIKERVKRISELIAESYGCTCSVQFKDSYPSLENDSKLFELVKCLGEQALGSDKIFTSHITSMGAEDFAYFCHAVPSFYMNLGTAHADRSLNYPLHSDKYNPVEESMKNGILMEILTALSIIETENQKETTK